QHKDQGSKLATDLADGVAAGKIDHAKVDADVRDLSKAIAATKPGVQDAINRLHKTLDPAQRKKLVETMRAKGEEMREHGMGEHGMGEHGMGGMQGKPGEHGVGEGGMEGHMGPLADLGLTPEQKDKIHVKLEPQMKAQQAAMKDNMTA